MQIIICINNIKKLIVIVDIHINMKKNINWYLFLLFN